MTPEAKFSWLTAAVAAATRPNSVRMIMGAFSRELITDPTTERGTTHQPWLGLAQIYSIVDCAFWEICGISES